jgi:hypothetical protein
MSRCIICGAETISGERICPSCKASKHHQESEIWRSFVCCPICGSGKIQVHVVLGGEDTLSCLGCGARWNIHFSHVRGHLKWAKLELEADDGKGKELLGKQIEVDKWKEMALESRKKLRVTRDR